MTDAPLEPRILIVSGKGGTGKTTVASALATLGARRGLRVCVAETEGEGALAGIFAAEPLGYEPSELSPGLWGMSINADDALAEYLRVQYRMRIPRVFRTTNFVEYITAAAPGLGDVLVLGKIWWLEQGRHMQGLPPFDLIVVDAPSSGHLLTFLGSPQGLADAVRTGPINRQARWLTEMLQDPGRLRVHLVANPEEMAVTETIETAARLKEEIGIEPGATFANSLYPQRFELEETRPQRAEELIAKASEVGLDIEDDDVRALLAEARFLEGRTRIQNEHLSRLEKEAPAPVISLPFIFSERLGLPEIELLADAIEQGQPLK